MGKNKMKQKKTGYGIISLSVVAALFFVVALKSVGRGGRGRSSHHGGERANIGAAYGGGGDTTSSLLRTSDVSTSTSKVMVQEDEDTFNIVSMDGSSKSTQKTNKRKGADDVFVH